MKPAAACLLIFVLIGCAHMQSTSPVIDLLIGHTASHGLPVSISVVPDIFASLQASPPKMVPFDESFGGQRGETLRWESPTADCSAEFLPDVDARSARALPVLAIDIGCTVPTESDAKRLMARWGRTLVAKLGPGGTSVQRQVVQPGAVPIRVESDGVHGPHEWFSRITISDAAVPFVR